MPKTAKRRFVGLNTDEVSLVDTPANEVDFLVIKNQEGLRMSGAAKKQAEVVELDVVEGGDAAVAKALEHVNGIVTKITGLMRVKKETKAPVEGGESDDDDSDDNDDDGKEVDVETTTKSVTVESVLAEAGLDAKATKVLVEKLKKEFPFIKKPGKGKGKGKGKSKVDDDDDDDDDEKKTKKSKADEDLAEVMADEPLTMAGLALAVQKAAAFTPQRIKALQSAQDILKLVLESVAPATSPDSNVPALDTHPNQSHISSKPAKKITKSLNNDDESEIVTTLKSLATAVGGLVDRVEAIEKHRGASNSVEPDGSTDTTTKKAASLWSGVL